MLIGRDLKVRYHHWLAKEESTIFHDGRRGVVINDTRIKYLLVTGKLYEVTDIDFSDLILEAKECDLDVSDVPEEEIFTIEQFKDFRIKLVNGVVVERLLILRDGRIIL